MSKDDIFSVLDLGIEDHQISSLKYSGENILNKYCVCGVTTLGRSFLSGLTEIIGLNPVGYFVATIEEITNPVEYANGGDPKTKFIRSIRSEVFVYREITIIMIEKPNLCEREFIEQIFNLVKPEKIYILDSVKKDENLKITFLSNKEEKSINNIIDNISAGFLIMGKFENIEVNVHYLTVNKNGSSSESMKLWADSMKDIFQINSDNMSKHANYIAQIREKNINSIYS